MGIFISCCKNNSSESKYLSYADETKRLKLAAAAEKRIREQECRGIKNPDSLKLKMKRLEKLEKKQNEAMKAHGNEGPKLTWTVG